MYQSAITSAIRRLLGLGLLSLIAFISPGVNPATADSPSLLSHDLLSSTAWASLSPRSIASAQAEAATGPRRTTSSSFVEVWPPVPGTTAGGISSVLDLSGTLASSASPKPSPSRTSSSSGTSRSFPSTMSYPTSAIHLPTTTQPLIAHATTPVIKSPSPVGPGASLSHSPTLLPAHNSSSLALSVTVHPTSSVGAFNGSAFNVSALFPSINATSTLNSTTAALPTTQQIMIPTSTPSLSTESSSTTTPLPAPTVSSASDFAGATKLKLPVGAIMGLVVGILAMIAAGIVIFIFCKRRRERRRLEDDYLPKEGFYSNNFTESYGGSPVSPLAQHEDSEKGYGYGVVRNLPPNNALLSPNNGLLSPATARDPFNLPPVTTAAAVPTMPYGVLIQRQRQDTSPILDADLAVSYPAAGRLATYPKKTRSWGRSRGRKKMASLTYRPNSTLTDSERNSASKLIRIESASSNEDPRGEASSSGHVHSKSDERANAQAKRNRRQDIYGARREITTPSTIYSVGTGEQAEENQPQGYSGYPQGVTGFARPLPELPQFTRPRPAPSPPSISGSEYSDYHPRARADEGPSTVGSSYDRSITGQLAVPSFKHRPDSDDSNINGIVALLNQRSAAAVRTPQGEVPPMMPNKPPPAHFIKRARSQRGSPTQGSSRLSPTSTFRSFSRGPGSPTRGLSSPTRPGPSSPTRSRAAPTSPTSRSFRSKPAYDTSLSRSRGVGMMGVPGSLPEEHEHDQSGTFSGPSTFGEEGTFGRTSDDWPGGKAF